MRTFAVTVFAAIWTLFLAASPLGADPLRAGQSARDFTLDTLGGQVLRLSESLGEKATLIVFWATWSPRSLEALADFQKMYEEQGQNALRVIAVNVEHQAWDPTEAGHVVSVLDQLGVRYPVVLDKDLSVFKAYGFNAVPSVVLTDQQGQVIDFLPGYPGTLRFEFREKVLKTLGAPRPEPAGRSEASAGYVPKGKAGVHFQMGKMLFRKGSRERGLQLVMKAVAEDPNYAEANAFLAEALERLGRFDEAKRVLAQVANLTNGAL